MSQYFLFLDWLPLRDPALEADTEAHPQPHPQAHPLVPLTRGMKAEEIRDECMVFATAIETIRTWEDKSWSRDLAAPKAFIEDRRGLFLKDPAAEIVAGYLNETGYASRSMAAALSRSGFVAIVIKCESSTSRTDYELTFDQAESAAAMLFRLIGIATLGRAPQRGFEFNGIEDSYPFLISPLAIMPVSADREDIRIDSAVDTTELARNALTLKHLKKLRIDKGSSDVGRLLRNGDAPQEFEAVDAVAQRYAVAAEQAIRQIESVILPREDASPNAQKIRNQTTDGYERLKEIAEILFKSSMSLCILFFLIIVLPSLSPINSFFKPGIVNENAIPWLFALFFLLATFISISVMGLDGLFDHRSQRDPSKWAIGAWFARRIYANRHVLPVIVTVFLVCAGILFWGSKYICSLLGTECLTYNLLADKSNSTFTNVLVHLVWALPALGVGLLKFSHDRLADITIGTKEDSRYQDFLKKFEPVLAAGADYCKQLKNAIGVKPEELHLPDFERIRERISWLRSSIAEAIEQARMRFNRTAATTVVLVGALATLPGLSEFKPDKPPDPADRFARAFEAGHSAGENGGIERCLVKGEPCAVDEQVSWNSGYSAGMQARSFREINERLDKAKLNVTVNVDGHKPEDLGKLITESVIAALRHKGKNETGESLTKGELLVKAITMGITEAPHPPSPEPSLKVDTKQIAREILEQFKEDSFPVLHALPKPCRPDSRLVAAVYFVRTKTNWAQATCVSIKGKQSYRTVAGKVGQEATNERDACWINKAPEEKIDKAKSHLSSAIAEYLKARPAVRQVLVVGYADSTGPVNSNIRVSNERAATVANYLRQQLENKTPDVSISAIGRSEASLAGDFRRGDLYQSAASRRAEIRLCYPSPSDANAVLRCAGYCGD
jgi:hypothetical protein